MRAGDDAFCAVLCARGQVVTGRFYFANKIKICIISKQLIEIFHY